MKIDQVKYVYFLGIGGIGMSGLARYFRHIGCEVAGYDRTETELTRTLEQEGVPVAYADNFDLVPDKFRVQSPETLIVYTPAVPRDLSLLTNFRERGHTLYKRAEVLGLISQGQYTIAIAGTHGKTTTSSMVAHILTDSGYGCSAFLGGITTNYGTNTLFGENNVLVVEADEYDRSFLTLHPDIAILTSADADHLDIYGDHAQLHDSFRLFLEQVTPHGKKIIHEGLPFTYDISYSAYGAGQVYAEHIRILDGSYYFDYVSDQTSMEGIKLGLPGQHNVSNAVAAITAALELGIAPQKIKSALANFAGVKRRFEYLVNHKQHVYIDDYAHHPAELKAFLGAVRELYPDKKLTLVFQPHLFTRTRDFMAEFAQELSQVDTLLLMDIYPARELPIAGVDSGALLDQIHGPEKHLFDAQAVINYVKESKPAVLLTAGAGNIDQLVQVLKEVLSDG